MQAPGLPSGRLTPTEKRSWERSRSNRERLTAPTSALDVVHRPVCALSAGGAMCFVRRRRFNSRFSSRARESQLPSRSCRPLFEGGGRSSRLRLVRGDHNVIQRFRPRRRPLRPHARRRRNRLDRKRRDRLRRVCERRRGPSRSRRRAPAGSHASAASTPRLEKPVRCVYDATAWSSNSLSAAPQSDDSFPTAATRREAESTHSSCFCPRAWARQSVPRRSCTWHSCATDFSQNA
jgi:hypothetical protein